MTLSLPRASSNKTDQFRESAIRETMRLAALHRAINLGQGVPDFPCPPELKESAQEAILADVNQYAITWGDRLLRQAIATKTAKCSGLKVDPETQITVTCGATEAMIATLVALVNAQEEVILFEPFYENYGAEIIIAGTTPRYVRLNAPHWTFDESELAAAFNRNTRAIIINSPHNPTSKVFSKEEMLFIAALCQKWGVIAITDEIYEHILYDGNEHISLGALPGMEDLTVTLNSLSKTYSVTGWRVGWAIASQALSASIRKVHDFLTIGAPAPLQRGGVKAINMPQNFYTELAKEYEVRRSHMLETLDLVGIPYFKPQGAYYVFCDISRFGFENDLSFAQYLIEKVGVAVVPGSSFRAPQTALNQYVRFCFSRKLETLEAARQVLAKASLNRSSAQVH
jgi:aspartate/methionine/tyrosine aminotransferase